MAATGFLDVCRFNPTLGGTTDWTYSSAVTGYQSPASANAVNGTIYTYRAESNDLSQWEIGYGAYNTSTGVLSRTTVLFNSAGTTAKISFSTVPQIAIVALAEDLLLFKKGQIPGSDGTASASTGNIGEYISASVPYASRTTLASGTAKTITSISVPAGDFDISACVNFEGTGTAVTSYVIGAASLSNNANDFVDGAYGYGPCLTAAQTDTTVFVANARKLFATPTTVYLVATMSLNSGTSVASWGSITARRRN